MNIFPSHLGHEEKVGISIADRLRIPMPECAAAPLGEPDPDLWKEVKRLNALIDSGITSVNAHAESGFWERVYAASIAGGLGSVAAPVVADKAVETWRKRWLSPREDRD